MSVLTCIYCSKVAETREHIPARHFFKGTPEGSLITVPSCKVCNAGFQKDEDFFRQFISGFLMDRSPRAKQLIDNEITRSIKRRPALALQMFSQMQLVNVYTKSWIYLGRRTVYRVSDSDRERVNRIVKKIIQGLFFHEFNQILPLDWSVAIVWINPKVEKEQKLTELATTLKWNVIKEDTFAYGVNHVPKTFQSVWMLDFFKVPLFYVLVLDKKTVKEIPVRRSKMQISL